MKTRSLLLAAAALAPVPLAAGAAALAGPEGYHLLKTVPVPGDGGWDYLTVDEAGRRVYVSHGDEVAVLDADSYEVAGKVGDLKGVHGIAVAPDLGRGFISNGRGNNVTIFELKSLKPVGTVDTGKNPDAIIFDPSTQRVFAFNGGGGSATAIDAKDGKVIDTVDLGGKPEFAVADGKGMVYVNLEDKSQIAKLDAAKLKVLERFDLAPGEGPSGLAMDRKTRRLFSTCHNKTLVVVDADSGKVVTTQPIGGGVDAAAFDPETGLVFASCGEGVVSVIHEDGPDKYTAAEPVKTQPRSKTMALDPKTHNLFLPGAEFKPDPNNPNGRPKMTPGTFMMQVYGK
jgi:DNA-binding beta-propeller fold protein YncE